MLFCFVLFSCGSAPKKETEEIQPPVQSEETQNSVNVDETIDYSDDDSVELINEIVEIEEILDEDDEEYIRSTNELKNDELVTKEEFIDLTQMKFIPPKTSQEDLIKLFDEKKAKIEEKFRTAFS